MADMHQGWIGPDAAIEAWQQDRIRRAFIQYPRGAVREYKRYAPWDRAMKIALGGWPKFFRQESGDCVSWGMCNALQWLSMGAIATGKLERFAYCYQPYAYAVGRNAPEGGNGQMGSGGNAGSLGSWQIAATRKRGQLFYADDSGLEYSGAIAEQWGGNRTTPWKKWEPIAIDNVIEAAAKINTVEEARDCICNGGAITIASSVGYRMQAVKRHGKWWFEGKANWNHQKCICAWAPAGDTGDHPACFFDDNSWGAKAHGITEIIDGPPTGAWISEERFDDILHSRGAEVFGIGVWKGFPANELDLHTF